MDCVILIYTHLYVKHLILYLHVSMLILIISDVTFISNMRRAYKINLACESLFSSVMRSNKLESYGFAIWLNQQNKNRQASVVRTALKRNKKRHSLKLGSARARIMVLFIFSVIFIPIKIIYSF